MFANTDRARTQPHAQVIRNSATLPRGAILRVVDGAGLTVHALAGRLWLTQEGDARDIVLHAGASLRLERDGVALIQALDPADVVLSAPRVREQPEPRGRIQLVSVALAPSHWSRAAQSPA